jgi:hypothetical protein
MSDSDIPNRFGPAIRWVLIVIALFVFFLLGAEEFKEGKYVSGGVFAALFVLTFVVAVKWEQIAALLGRDKVTLALIGVGLLCALGLGVVIGALLMRGGSPEAPRSTGRIVWNFDQMARGQANFLNLGRLNQDEIRVLGFGAHGKNTSKDPITEFSGYVRSDLTNARLPIFIVAENPDAPAQMNPFEPSHIPTRPEETFGIPGLADFDIVSHEQAMPQTGVDGIPISKFLREFGSFTVVLEYDGLKVEQQFSSEQIRKTIEKFEHDLNPQPTTIPRVTRRPNATPPLQPTLPFIAAPATPSSPAPAPTPAPPHDSKPKD